MFARGVDALELPPCFIERWQKVGLTARFESVDLTVDHAAQPRHGFKVDDDKWAVIETDDAQ